MTNAANPKHYIGKPCARCKKKLRYVTTRNCVACAKLAVATRRFAALPTAETKERVDWTDDDGRDLIGDIGQ